MPILLGALSSLFIGVSDAIGRSVSRRVDAISHVATAMLAGVGVAAVIAVVSGDDLIGRDLIRGGVSGLFIASALALLYHGMAVSSAAVTSPVAAVFVGLIPLAWDLARGAVLGATVLTGCIVALSSLALTTLNPNLADRVRSGVVFGVVSGVLFGISLIVVGETAESSGAWPAATQRLAGFAAMAALAWHRSVPVFSPGRLRRLSAVSGLVGTLGIVAFVIGLQRGDIGVVSVAGSMFPAVTAVLSAVFDDDELRWWQTIGIAGSLTGLALIALG